MGDAMGGVPVCEWCVWLHCLPPCVTPNPCQLCCRIPCQPRLLLCISVPLPDLPPSSPPTSALSLTHPSPLLSPAGAAFLLWELSTPLVHLRWVLSQAGAGSTRLYLANGLAMVVVFFACRPAWGTYMSYRVRVTARGKAGRGLSRSATCSAWGGEVGWGGGEERAGFRTG